MPDNKIDKLIENLLLISNQLRIILLLLLINYYYYFYKFHFKVLN